jgi:hypothetical protein
LPGGKAVVQGIATDQLFTRGIDAGPTSFGNTSSPAILLVACLRAWREHASVRGCPSDRCMHFYLTSTTSKHLTAGIMRFITPGLELHKIKCLVRCSNGYGEFLPAFAKLDFALYHGCSPCGCHHADDGFASRGVVICRDYPPRIVDYPRRMVMPELFNPDWVIHGTRDW